MEEFPQKEGAYALIQSTRPQTLASGLNDSPAGLAAWIYPIIPPKIAIQWNIVDGSALVLANCEN
jgi:hypothetical protein